MASSTRTLPVLAVLASAWLAPIPAHPAEVAKVPPPAAPIALAPPKDFATAVQVLEAATGAKGEKMRVGDVPLEEGRSFAADPHVAERLLLGSHAAFRKAGFYLFRYERGFGMAGDKDQLGLLRGTDQNAIVRRVGTAGTKKQPTNDKIIAWLDALAKDEPFELVEVGVDYLAGRFRRVPKDAMAIAKRCAELAPDLVAGRASTLELLAREIAANRTLYLIW
jgi:hypothetical protein